MSIHSHISHINLELSKLYHVHFSDVHGGFQSC